MYTCKKNAVRNNIDNIIFFQSDWLKSVKPDSLFDLIVSNPPYIEPNDPHLKQGDLRFEPQSALIANDNGLSDLSTIIESAPKHLKQNGWLIVEHGYNQADPVSDLFKAQGFGNIELRKDLTNLPRCTLGQYLS